ncbi:MAG: type II secretion system protein E [Anaerolinea sp.]|nr:type II secretion system protein E [Anaerolinea sp.]
MFTNRPAMKKDTPTQILENQNTFNNLQKDFFLLRDSVQKDLLSTNNNDSVMDSAQLRTMIEDCFNRVLEEQNLLYNHAVHDQLLEWVIADIIGYGPLEPLLKNPDITEIMVNGPFEVFIERFGLIDSTPVKFESDAHLRRVIDRIVSPIGRRVDETSPMVDARLPNGYRVNATIPPLSLDGPILTIRKFATRPYTAQDLIANGTMTVPLVNFIKACVEAKVNLVVSGGTGTGKTTLLNVLSTFIPERERIITIEDTGELQLNQIHVVRLEKRPPNIEGKGEVTIRQLVINALRMRPDRILVGECRGGEALDMLQAMNTGHDGSMTTVHSNSPRDALRRIETMVLMAGMDLPLKAIREQLASSIELVIHLDRLKDGTRRVVQVTEVQGLESDTIVMQDLFIFNQTGIINGMVQGNLKSTGLRPKFISKLIENSIELPDGVFDL